MLLTSCTSIPPTSIWMVDLGSKNWRTRRATASRADSLRGTIEENTVAEGRYISSNSALDLLVKAFQNLCTSVRTWSGRILLILHGRISPAHEIPLITKVTYFIIHQLRNG